MSGFLENVFGSDNSNNHIHVHLDKRRYNPGDMVTGSVNLSISTPMNVDAIYVKFKGFELTKLVQLVTSSRTVNGVTTTTTQRVPHRQKLIMFQHRVALQSFKALMNPGIFVYPFSFQLPANLPGSFIHEKPAFYGQIAYKVKAEVVRPGILADNMKHFQFINVISPLKQQIHKVQRSHEMNVTKCYCIDMGSVEVSAILNQNAYHPGQIVKVIVAVDNTESDVSLRSVSYSLIHEVHLRAVNYALGNTVTINSNDGPKIKKGDTAYIEFSFALPYFMAPSIKANIVNSTYSIMITLSVPYSSDLVLELPIQVYELVPANNNNPTPSYPVQPHFSTPIHVNPSMYSSY